MTRSTTTCAGSPCETNDIAEDINSRPRPALDWDTAHEWFWHQLQGARPHRGWWSSPIKPCWRAVGGGTLAGGGATIEVRGTLHGPLRGESCRIGVLQPDRARNGPARSARSPTAPSEVMAWRWRETERRHRRARLFVL